MSVTIRPVKVVGNWRDGFALDYHTVSSTLVGYDEFGSPQFETTRSEVGELLFRLKYRSDTSVLQEIVEASARFVEARRWLPEVLVPVPPSRQRAWQPTLVLGMNIAERLGIAYADCVTRLREVPELKNVFDADERQRLLRGLHAVDPSVVTGRRVLLFDDLYRSGATMNSVADELLDKGRVLELFALLITRTRKNR